MSLNETKEKSNLRKLIFVSDEKLPRRCDIVAFSFFVLILTNRFQISMETELRYDDNDCKCPRIRLSLNLWKRIFFFRF